MAWKDFFTGGAFSAIEGIAKEWIDTPQENAEAKALGLKILDPNGKMRRDQSNRVGSLYTSYFTLTAILIVFRMFYAMYIGADLQESDYILIAVSDASETMKDLFVPITTLYGAIVTASFGVSYANIKQGK